MLSLSTGVIVQRCASRMSVVVVEVMRIDYYFIIDTFLIDNDVIVAFNVIAWSVTFLIVFVIMTSSSGCIIR